MDISGPLYKLLLGKKGDVADLVTEARRLSRLTRLLQNELDSALAPHCQVTRLAPPELTILTDSPVWATRLRLHASVLAKQLHEKYIEFQKVEYIEVKVYPSRHETPDPEPLPRQISSEAANSIIAMAQSLEDEPLKEALLKLAKHASEPRDEG